MEDNPIGKSETKVLLALLILPLMHFSACLIIAFKGIQRGWERLVIIDFPFSILMVGLSFRSDRPLLWFGLLGSLWWLFLSWLVWFLLSGRKSRMQGSAEADS